MRVDMNTNSSISSESAYGKCKLTYTFIGTIDEIDCVIDYIEKMYDECDFNNEDVVNNEPVKKDVVQHDAVNKPTHYCSGKIETIDKIESVIDGLPAKKAAALSNVLKYFDRAGLKDNAEQDLSKANNYAFRLVTGKWRNASK